MHDKKVNQSSNDQQQQLNCNEYVQESYDNKISNSAALSRQLEFYIQFLGKPIKVNKKQLFNKQSEYNKIKYTQNFYHNIQIATLQTDFQSTRIQVSYGNFKIQIQTIFTNIEQYFFIHYEPIAKGSFGTIYNAEVGGTVVAIKRIGVSQKSNTNQFKQIYKQYFLYLLASFLEVGPKIIPIFGYDIIRTNDAIFFVMEMCEMDRQKNIINLEEDLKNNLLKMHSISFIHLDIKPSNIAYSKRLNKYVFLDFGISRLIFQNIGQNSLTSFAGTFSYCSDQMKKCCILQKKSKIDLYYNDLVGLLISIKKIKHNAQLYKNSFFEQEDHSKLKLNQINECVFIFKIKYNLFNSKFDQCLQVLRSNYKNMPKCTFKLLQKFSYDKTNKNKKQFESIYQQVKQQLIISKFISHKYDEDLNTCLCQNTNFQTSSQILPILKILSMPKQKNRQYLNNVNEIYKLFIFINPFSYQNQGLNNFDLDDVRKKLIKKIYQTFNCIQDNLNCRYVSFVLSFFYLKLKKLNNVKVFLSLRLLFISIQQFDYVEEIQIKIIQLIFDINLKLLKLIQFELFSNISLRDYNCKSKPHKIKLLNQINILTNMNNFMQKLKQLANLIYHRQIYMIIQWQNCETIFSKISELKQMNEQVQYKQIITTIEYLYLQKVGSKLPNCKQFPNILTLKIYSYYFKYFNAFYEKQKKKHFQYIICVFPSIFTQLKIIYKQKQDKQLQHLLMKIFEYQIQGNLCKLQNFGRTIMNNTQQYYYFCVTKQLVIRYSKRVTQLILQDEVKCESQIYQFICFIQKILFLIKISNKFMPIEKKLSQIQLTQIYNKIANIHIYIQNQQIYKNEKQQHFKIYSKIIQFFLMYRFHKNKQRQIQNILVKIIDSLYPYPYKQIKLVINFYNVLTNTDNCYLTMKIKYCSNHLQGYVKHIYNVNIFMYFKLILKLYAVILSQIISEIYIYKVYMLFTNMFNI